jgi:hypothetical protein
MQSTHVDASDFSDPPLDFTPPGLLGAFLRLGVQGVDEQAHERRPLSWVEAHRLLK